MFTRLVRPAARAQSITTSKTLKVRVHNFQIDSKLLKSLHDVQKCDRFFPLLFHTHKGSEVKLTRRESARKVLL